MMEPKLSKELLSVDVCDRAPISGTVHERHYDLRGQCTWFRFVLDACEEWAGAFGNAEWRIRSSTAKFADSRSAIVTASGQGYIIDGVSGQLFHKTESDVLCGAISIPNQEFVVACCYTDILAYNKSGLIWKSPRIALDGIELKSATETELTGEHRQIDGWYPFTLTYDGWKLETTGKRIRI